MKKLIRKEILQKRKRLTEDEVKSKSQIISNRVIYKGLISSKNTLLYMDFRNEVMTKQLIDYCLDHFGSVLIPRVENNRLTIHEIHHTDDLILSNYGILEPEKGKNEVSIDTIDLILAPGVAFDEKGFRLGYGGGFYDRLLSKKRKEVPVIALSFECQLIESVPTEPHDYKMNMIITESRVIKPE